MIYLRVLIFIKKAINKLNFPKNMKNFLEGIIYRYVEKKILSHLKSSKKLVENDNEPKGNNSGNIWIFWWQGYDDMPLIVKKCIESVQYNSGNHKVILITKDNIFDYVEVSNDVLKKFIYGKITITHFSDILRFKLLSKYGGLWMDATIYCTSEITDDYFNNIYTSGRYYGTEPKFVSGKWTGFLIGGNSNNPLFKFMNYFFESYWSKNDNLIHYFLIDYGLEYAYKNDVGGFKKYIDNEVINNNPNLFNLSECLNDEFNSDKYLNMISNTTAFKLTYKMKFKKNSTTFYNKIISDDSLFKNN